MIGRMRTCMFYTTVRVFAIMMHMCGRGKPCNPETKTRQCSVLNE